MSDLVIREVIAGTIVTFSKPFRRIVAPVGGRSTAIKLSNSSVWLLASTPLTDETREKLDQLGSVKYIAVADIVHTMFTAQYAKAYPDAKIFGPEGTAQKTGLNVHEWTTDENHNPMEYEDQVLKDEIKAEYFHGFVNKDIAFCHVPTKTLIQADLLFNLPANEQYSKSNELPSKLFNHFMSLKPDSLVHRRFLYNAAATDKAAMARSAFKVDQWDFDRIIPCHGDVIETGGKAAWRNAFSLYFDDIKNGKFPGLGQKS